jgi:hypothetical protein
MESIPGEEEESAEENESTQKRLQNSKVMRFKESDPEVQNAKLLQKYAEMSGVDHS